MIVQEEVLGQLWLPERISRGWAERDTDDCHCGMPFSESVERGDALVYCLIVQSLSSPEGSSMHAIF